MTKSEKLKEIYLKENVLLIISTIKKTRENDFNEAILNEMEKDINRWFYEALNLLNKIINEN